jgi:hypothetical protein
LLQEQILVPVEQGGQVYDVPLDKLGRCPHEGVMVVAVLELP